MATVANDLTTSRVARIHIGPVKTGSTSLQQMLRAGWPRMAQAGFLCPSAPGGQAYHLEAVCDFLNLRTSPAPPMDGFASAYVAHRPRRRRGAWGRLTQEVAAHGGPTVITCELLGFFNEAAAGEFVAGLPVDRVEVVMVDRCPSALLTSWYQEQLKRQSVPDFDSYLRCVFDALASGSDTEFDFIDTRRIHKVWSAVGADVTVIDASDGLADRTITEIAEALTPELTWTVTSTRANAGMSALGAQLWRAHYAAARPAFIGSALAVHRRMLTAYPETSRGPRVQMPPEAATALDRFCGGVSGVLAPQLPAAPALPPLPASSQASRSDPPFDTEAVLTQLRHWQRIEDARWRAFDAASRLCGRGPLMRALA